MQNKLIRKPPVDDTNHMSHTWAITTYSWAYINALILIDKYINYVYILKIRRIVFS